MTSDAVALPTNDRMECGLAAYRFHHACSDIQFPIRAESSPTNRMTSQNAPMTPMSAPIVISIEIKGFVMLTALTNDSTVGRRSQRTIRLVGELTTSRRSGMLRLEMPKRRLLGRAREKWLARSFQGLFLIASAAAAGEAFLKLPLAWRWALVSVVIVSFVLGLYFAKADAGEEE